MKVFHCDHCSQLVFFENTKCLSCGHRVAYLPDLGLIGSLETDKANPGLWHSPPLHAAAGRTYWEDWAETWAHYLHMIDTLEMAAACGMSLWPERQDEPTLQALPTATAPRR
jgi:hypothetical protein